MSDQTHDDPWLYEQHDRIHSSTCEEGPNHNGPCHPTSDRPDAPIKVRVKFEIDAALWQRFQKASEDRVVSPSWLANKALDMFLAQLPPLEEVIE